MVYVQYMRTPAMLSRCVVVQWEKKKKKNRAENFNVGGNRDQNDRSSTTAPRHNSSVNPLALSDDSPFFLSRCSPRWSG